MDIMRTYGADQKDPFMERKLDLWDPETELSHQGSYGTWRKMFGVTIGITCSQFIIVRASSMLHALRQKQRCYVLTRAVVHRTSCR